MLIRSWHALVLSTLLLCTLATAQELKPEKLYQKMLPSVMTLLVEKKDGTQAIGTAFLSIKDGMAVTAWHVVNGAKRAVARFSDGEEFDVSGLVDKDEQRDVALIKVKVFGRQPLTLSPIEPAVGSVAYIIGAPKGLEFSISNGLISQVQTLGGIKNYQFTCSASPGNSGGPLLDDKGNVTGVVSWQAVEGQNLNFAMPSTYVLGLDASLATKPWEEVKASLGRFNDKSSSDNEVDKAIISALIVLHNFSTTYLASDMQTAGTGFLRGVTSDFYIAQQDLQSARASLTAIKSTGELRPDIISALILRFQKAEQACELYIKAIMTGQVAEKWTPLANGLCEQSRASLTSSSRNMEEFAPFIIKLYESSTAFRDGLPLELQYEYGIKTRPSIFSLGAGIFVQDSLLLVVVVTDSFGDDLGFQSGDRIIAIGQQVLIAKNSIEDAKLLISQNLGKRIKVTVFRNGKERTFTMNIPKTIPKSALYK